MKRSSKVALLLMGVTGAGAAGYALTKPPTCVPQGSPPSAAAPGRALQPGAEPCPPGRVWSSSESPGWTRSSRTYSSRSSAAGSSASGRWWPMFSRTSTTTSRSSSVPFAGRSSTTTSRSSTTTTSRSGFGSSSRSYFRISS